ncbi:hypothetical protein ACFLYU_02000 [Candidatus Dependentiae bacterium]
MQKRSTTFLCAILVCSLAISPATLATNPDGNNKTESQPEGQTEGGWADAIITIAIAAAIQSCVVGLIEIAFKWFNKEYSEREKLRNLIDMNEKLKKQLCYIKSHCHDIRIIKKAEQQYLRSCIEVMELQKKYLQKYAKK